MCYKSLPFAEWCGLRDYMSGSSTMALCTRNVHITVYDVTTWSRANLVNPVPPELPPQDLGGHVSPQPLLWYALELLLSEIFPEAERYNLVVRCLVGTRTAVGTLVVQRLLRPDFLLQTHISVLEISTMLRARLTYQFTYKHHSTGRARYIIPLDSVARTRLLGYIIM